MKKEPIGTPYHLDPEEVVQRTKVLHGKLGAEASRELTEKLGRGSSQDDIVDVEQQVSRPNSVLVDEQRGIRAGGHEAKLLKEGSDPLVPSTRGLLEPIERAREQAHVIRLGGVDEADRLLAVDLLGKVAMKKRVGDIHLVDGPGARDRQLQDGADGTRFDNRSESVGEVHTGTLAETANDPTSLVSLKGPIRSSLVPKDPLAADHISMRRPRHQLPGAVALKSVKLLHRGEPMRITESRSSRRW